MALEQGTTEGVGGDAVKEVGLGDVSDGEMLDEKRDGDNRVDGGTPSGKRQMQYLVRSARMQGLEFRDEGNLKNRAESAALSLYLSTSGSMPGALSERDAQRSLSPIRVRTMWAGGRMSVRYLTKPPSYRVDVAKLGGEWVVTLGDDDHFRLLGWFCPHPAQSRAEYARWFAENVDEFVIDGCDYAPSIRKMALREP